MRIGKVALSLAALLLVTACTSKPPEQPASTQPGAAAPEAAAPASNATANAPAATTTPGATAKRAPAPSTASVPPAAAAPVAVPAGTVLTVRLGQTVGSKSSQAGEEFQATLAEPVESNGNVLIPKGATARGVVEEAVPLGKFKGGARLRLSLREITIDGKSYPVQTSSVERSEKGKGKRTATLIGGGAGVGALIGGLAGGGKGAAIGALAGGGAGTAGAAYTGNKDIVLPAESALSFKLLQPVEVKK
jgi:pectin methylesterase-like acyl-CoA thioesterase